MKSKIIENVLIEKIGYEGVGIGKLTDGKKIIIKGGALPGNIVDCKVVRNRKDHIQAHIINIKKHNPEYFDNSNICPHFFYYGSTIDRNEVKKQGCGGCKRQTMTYEKQIGLKQLIIKEIFQRIQKNIPDLEIRNILGSPVEKGYRNKIEFSFGKYITKSNLNHPGESELAFTNHDLTVLSDRSLGFHKQGEFSKIVDIDHCDLIDEKLNQIYIFLKSLLLESGLPVHDQMRHQGFFRHLVIRQGQNTDQILVNLSVFEKFLKESDKKNNLIWLKLKYQLKNNEFIQKNVKTFVITYNDSLADVIKSNEVSQEILFGDGYIFEDLQYGEISVRFRVSPFSFFQTNTVGAEKLFSTAMSMIGEINGTILDLYCGTGSIGISLLKCGIGKRLVGIEIVEDAIKDAWYNAELNNIKDKVYFVSSPAEKILNKSENEINSKLKDLGLVVIDPPRDGLHKDVLNFLIQLKEKYDYKLLYISCNPVTMARDIQLFYEGGLITKVLQPVDMFPQTHHIECIGILD